MTVGDSGRHAMELRMGTVGIWWRGEVETQMERQEVERGEDLAERWREELWRHEWRVEKMQREGRWRNERWREWRGRRSGWAAIG